MKRRVLLGLLVAALLAGGFVALRELRVGTGYAAKVLCSGVFVAGRSQESLLAEDLDWFWWVRPRIDREQRTASAHLLGLARSTAVYREGLGCALAVGASASELRAAGFEPAPGPDPASVPWPDGDLGAEAPLPAAQRKALGEAVAAAFSEPDASVHLRTRAVLVLRAGRVVAERYAPGFDAKTRLLGWSMTKSVIARLIGIQVLRGALDPASPAAVPAWSGDSRAGITLEHLLRMASGLDFVERNGAWGDSAPMLFRSRSAAGYAEGSALAHAPGAFWSYSSGTSNLLAEILRRSLGGDLRAYHRFPREALFDRIGMRSAVLETDAAGDFVGSSFGYATARDWARFGLLHAQDGVWNGERLLPEGWVAFVRRPTPAAPKGRYGAHWWLNAGDPGAPESLPSRRCPRTSSSPGATKARSSSCSPRTTSSWSASARAPPRMPSTSSASSAPCSTFSRLEPTPPFAVDVEKDSFERPDCPGFAAFGRAPQPEPSAVLPELRIPRLLAGWLRTLGPTQFRVDTEVFSQDICSYLLTFHRT